MPATIPILPTGHVAQPGSHRDEGDVCYEFHRVYDADGRLDRRRSFWMVTRFGGDERDVAPDRDATADVLTFGEYRLLFGRKALPFDAFAGWMVMPATIESWLAERRRPERQATGLRGFRRPLGRRVATS